MTVMPLPSIQARIDVVAVPAQVLRPMLELVLVGQSREKNYQPRILIGFLKYATHLNTR